MLVLEAARVGTLARGLDLDEADEGVAGPHRVVGPGLEGGKRGFANGNDIPALEQQDRREVGDQRLQGRAKLVFGRTDGGIAGELGLQRGTEAGNGVGERHDGHARGTSATVAVPPRLAGC